MKKNEIAAMARAAGVSTGCLSLFMDRQDRLAGITDPDILANPAKYGF